MTWKINHRISENAAQEAEMLIRQAKVKYLEAARAEEEALSFVDSYDKDLVKTYGITAVSAVALYIKSGNKENALRMAQKAVSNIIIPNSAKDEIVYMIRIMDNG